MNNLSPLTQPESLKSLIYSELRRSLMEGRLRPGEVLSWRGMAELLQVGVMPVREAVQQLAALRCLDVLPRRGVRVARLSEKRLREMLVARGLLEGEAAAIVANQGLSEMQYAQLREADAAKKAALARGAFTEALAANRRFHAVIYEAAGNDVLVELIENIIVALGPYHGIAFEGAMTISHVCTSDLHDRIASALKSGDADSVRGLLAADMMEAGDDLLPFIRPYLSDCD